MAETSDYRKNFVSTLVYDAIYQTTTETKNIIIEERTDADGNLTVFTIIDQQSIRTRSIQEISALPDCVSISILHTIKLLWNNEIKQATLREEISRNPEPSTIAPYLTRLQLIIDDQAYTTKDCDTFSEAVGELRTLIAEVADWRFMTCFHCEYAHLAFLSPMNDRYHLRCFRDVPAEIYREVKEKGKFASLDALYAGSYFVDGLHRCAAWQSFEPREVRSSE